MADDWFYEANGQPVGPISYTELAKLAARGTIKPADNVGQSNQTWAAASTIPGLVFPAAGITPTPQNLGYQARTTSATIITPRTVELLKQTGPWVRFLSIVMFISCGFMLMAAAILVFASLAGPRMPPYTPFFALFYVLSGLIYIWPGVLLFRYASRCKSFANIRNEDLLEQAIDAQRAFWKFIGILCIIILSLYLLSIPVIVIVAIFHAHR